MDELLKWLPLIIALVTSGGIYGMFRSKIARLEKDVDEFRETVLKQIRLEVQVKAIQETQREHSDILREVRDTVLLLRNDSENKNATRHSS